MNLIFHIIINDFLDIYLDHLSIFRNTKEEHLNHLRLVLSRLRDHHFFVRRDKHDILKEETEFLKLQAGWNGISIGKNRQRVIFECPKTANISELRIFLKHFSEKAALLTDLTQKHEGTYRWNASCD